MESGHFIDASPVSEPFPMGYQSQPTLTIKNSKATIEYAGIYSSADEISYKGVIPVKVASSGTSSTGLNCEALFTVTDENGYAFEALKIDEQQNGPFILSKDADDPNRLKYRDNFYSGERIEDADDKFYLNWNTDYSDRTWRNGEGGDFTL